MNFKGIYDAIMLFSIGGPIAVVGGLAGLYLGLDANATSGCVLNCPDPWRIAFYGTFPGIGIAAAQWIYKQFTGSGK